MSGAEDVIAALGLAPHSEGGWYRETWRAARHGNGRASGTAIYYLLRSGERSKWHCVDAAEVWHFYAGDPLLLSVSTDGMAVEEHTLGADVAAGQHPQYVVEAGTWQAARSLGEWSLVGCTVSPAFEFAGFRLAPEGWEPGAGGTS